MAINLHIHELIEDIDPTTRTARVRVRVSELKPRVHLVNLKNLDASQISVFQKNQGGILSVPAREYMMDGRLGINIPATDDEIFVISPPATHAVSQVVEFTPEPPETKETEQTNEPAKPTGGLFGNAKQVK